MPKNEDLVDKNFLKKLKYCGRGVKIFKTAKIIKPEVIEIGDFSQIDDFTFIVGGEGIKIGKRVHIASFTSIIGGGKCIIEDYAGLSAGCRIITGTELFTGEGMTNPCIPKEFRAVVRSFVKIEKHAILGTNVIVFPGVTIKEGSAIGAGSIVTKDCESWGIYIGAPARRVKERPKEKILEFEKKLKEKYGG